MASDLKIEGLYDAKTGNFQEVLPSEGYDVVEWSPSQDGTGHATAVCLVLPCTIADVPVRMMMRLKSRRAVDELIATLEKHRDGVWPHG